MLISLCKFIATSLVVVNGSSFSFFFLIVTQFVDCHRDLRQLKGFRRMSKCWLICGFSRLVRWNCIDDFFLWQTKHHTHTQPTPPSSISINTLNITHFHMSKHQQLADFAFSLSRRKKLANKTDDDDDQRQQRQKNADSVE